MQIVFLLVFLSLICHEHFTPSLLHSRTQIAKENIVVNEQFNYHLKKSLQHNMIFFLLKITSEKINRSRNSVRIENENNKIKVEIK